MGIEGLLQLLKPITSKTHISNFENKTAAIDVSAWLYKGAYSCSWELGNGLTTYGYLNYPLKMINLLQRHKIKPILVFDGLPIPIKEKTVAKRKDDKKNNRAKAEKLLTEGKRDEAATLFARSIKVKGSMINVVVDVLENIGVKYIVAPYEADAQIAYLVKENIADFAISEDSDLLVYGCENIVFKLDVDGSCENILIEKTLRNKDYIKDIKEEIVRDLNRLSKERFTELCIVSGCDYLANIPGLGMKKALKLMKYYNLSETLGKLTFKKQFQGKIPEKYKESVEMIKFHFMHAKVIDPRTYKMTELNPIPENASPNYYEELGKNLDPALVEDYAKGLYSMKKGAKRVRHTNQELDRMLKEMTVANREKYQENKVRSSKPPQDTASALKDIGAKFSSLCKKTQEEIKKNINSMSLSEPKPKIPKEDKKESTTKHELNPLVKKELEYLLAKKLEEEALMDEENESTARGTVSKPGDLDENGIMPNPFATGTASVENQDDLPVGKRNVYCLFDGIRSLTYSKTKQENPN
jgi:exonuclease-1